MAKIQEFILVIIFVIFPQKLQFRLENEIFEISRNSALDVNILSVISNFVQSGLIGSQFLA